MGKGAGYGNSATGNYNSALGSGSLSSYTSGTNNSCIGINAGSSITSGSYNVIIGSNCNVNASTDSNEIVIGSDGITGKGSNTGFINPGGGGVYQGNNSTLWSVTSDERLKKNIVDNTVGLSAITQIKVRNFEYRLPKEVTELDQHCAVAITGVQLGPIAQELQQVLPDCVKTESTGVMSVDSSDVMWHMVNAIKELNAEVQSLKSKLGV